MNVMRFGTHVWLGETFRNVKSSGLGVVKRKWQGLKWPPLCPLCRMQTKFGTLIESIKMQSLGPTSCVQQEVAHFACKVPFWLFSFEYFNYCLVCFYFILRPVRSVIIKKTFSFPNAVAVATPPRWPPCHKTKSSLTPTCIFKSHET